MNNVLVSDLVGGNAVSVSCPSGSVGQGGSIIAGDTINCTYQLSPAAKTDGTNVATATFNSLAFLASADYKFGAPTDEIDECVDVDDTNVGFLGQVCAANAPLTFTYTLEFGQHPNADVQLICGHNLHPNTASFVTNDTPSTGELTWVIRREPRL